MSDFIKVDLDALKQARLKLIDLYDVIKENEKILNNVNNNLSFLPEGYNDNAKKITKISTSIGENVDDCTNAILSYAALMNMGIIDNLSVFSSFRHMYGSDQAGAIDLIRSYVLFPNLLSDSNTQKVNDIISLFEQFGITDLNEVTYLLNQAKTDGCGFAALTNNLFCAFEKIYGDDANSEFEKIHGYPMYYEVNGEKKYNFEVLFTEVFLKNSISRYDGVPDEPILKVISSLYGLNQDYSVLVDQYYEFFSNELPDGVNCEMKEYKVHDISIKTYLNDKEINGYDYGIVGVNNFTLKPYGNNPNTDEKHCDGGHWMAITGISPNGNFIVSSWGYEWELTSWGIINSGINIREDENGNKVVHDNSPRLIMIKVGDTNEN